MRQRRDALGVGMRGHASPHFAADRALRRPALLRQPDQHTRKPRIGALVQALNGPERRTHEKSFHHHLIPGFLRECFAGVGIAVRHGFEHRLHPGTNRFARARLDQRRTGIQRQPAAERDQLVDLGGAAKAVETRAEGGIVAAMRCGHQRNTRQLIEAPVAEVEARAQRVGARQLGRRERKVGFAEPPGYKTDRNSERTLVRGMRHIMNGAAKPSDAAVVCLL